VIANEAFKKTQDNNSSVFNRFSGGVVGISLAHLLRQKNIAILGRGEGVRVQRLAMPYYI
jgi:hypothetical protein